MGSVEIRVRGVARVIGGLSAEEAAEMDTFAEMAFDSLDAMEFAIGIEEAFDIEVSDEDIAHWKSIAGVVGFLTHALDNGGASNRIEATD